MMLPTDDEIRWNPGGALRAIRNVRCEMEVAESAAIRAAVAAGWSLRSVAIELGVSRQAVTQRLQRELGLRRPAAAIRRNVEAARSAEIREHEATLKSMAEEYFRDQAARRNAALAPPAA